MSRMNDGVLFDLFFVLCRLSLCSISQSGVVLSLSGTSLSHLQPIIIISYPNF